MTFKRLRIATAAAVIALMVVTCAVLVVLFAVLTAAPESVVGDAHASATGQDVVSGPAASFAVFKAGLSAGDRLEQSRLRSAFAGTPGSIANETGARRKNAARALDAGGLPAKAVSVTRRSDTVEWTDRDHEGGASELPNAKTAFGSAAQRRAATMLRRAGVPDGVAELERVTVASEIGRFDDFSWPSDEIRKLPADPVRLASTLRHKPLPYPLVSDSRPVAGDEELFHVAIGLLRSPFASPRLRAAVVRMIGKIPGVKTSDRARDVRSRGGFGVTLSTAVPEPQLVLDKRDSRVLGVNYRLEHPAAQKAGGLFALLLADRARAGTAFEPALVVRGAPVCSARTPSGRTIERYCASKVRPAG